ncbi:MAG TPA: hypothetical protein VNN79_16835 [Actinomycetota bacterium]|nr:hypothetical protein [Actinomycetota bacterium]
MTDLLRGLRRPTEYDASELTVPRAFTLTSLVALRYRDAPDTTVEGRAAAQEIADAILALANAWEVPL